MEHAQRLMKEKVALENEIRTLDMELSGMNVTRETPLVDAEGFPRSDIDIGAVREIQHTLICKKNDLKGLMAEIE
ncbi:putative 26S proteasome regulatory subunit, partial [Coemansia aciculifera]